MITVFMGTGGFAAAILQQLASNESFRPALVVSRPDRPAGRGRKLLSPPVVTLAREVGLNVIQPPKLHEPEVLEQVRALNPDALCVSDYGVLIKDPLLNDYEIYNVHPSLLPRWRGAAPIERAIMEGDAETGVSIMRITAGLDSGPVFAMQTEPITPEDDYATLTRRLELVGAELLMSVLANSPQPTDQQEENVTYAEKITAEDRDLLNCASVVQAERTVRALHPHVGARIGLIADRYLGVERARLTEGTTGAKDGLHADGEQLFLSIAGQDLELLTIKPPGGKAMTATDWLRGRPSDELLTTR